MYSSRAREFRSYRERNSFRSGFWKLIRTLIVILLSYLFVTHFLISSHRVESISMEPALFPSDRILTTTLTYGARVPFTRAFLPGITSPHRGDLVVAQPPYGKDPGLVYDITNPVVRFFTLQNRSAENPPTDWERNLVVKRVIGVPGDTVKMASFIAYIRPKGDSQFHSELEMTGGAYRPKVAPLPEGWTPDLPFSGTMNEITLGANQYFLLGDNRNRSVDSRYYGPVARKMILEKVLVRYFPFGRFGLPK